MNQVNHADLDCALDDAVGRAVDIEVEALLTKGANPNSRDPLGWTPLMNAAWVASPSLVRLLLQWGADPDATNPEGKTALDLARSVGHNKYGHEAVIEVLVAT